MNKMAFSREGSRQKPVPYTRETEAALKELASIETFEDLAYACEQCAEREAQKVKAGIRER
jgi:hypothetical protein